MSLSFLDRLTILLRGRNRPGFYTRIVYYLGFIFGWFYFFIWFLTCYFAVILTNMLDSSVVSRWKAQFNQIASFMGDDPLRVFQNYSLIQLGIFSIIFFGLCFFWRKWKIGLLLYIVGHLLSVGVTLYLLGTDYILNHLSYLDKVIFGIGFLPFIVYMLIFSGKRKKDNEDSYEGTR